LVIDADGRLQGEAALRSLCPASNVLPKEKDAERGR